MSSTGPVYFGYWADLLDMTRSFQITNDDIKDYRVLVAAYDDFYGYSGQAVVILIHRQTSKLYYVHGSHCSCSGLEGEWNFEDTSRELLQQLLDTTSSDLAQFCRMYPDFNKVIRKIIDAPTRKELEKMVDTMMPGFGEEYEKEIRKIADEDRDARIAARANEIDLTPAGPIYEVYKLSPLYKEATTNEGWHGFYLGWKAALRDSKCT